MGLLPLMVRPDDGWKSEHECREAALRLVVHLNEKVGGDWRPEVHENLGWYYCVRLGTMRVYESFGKYTCGISNDSMCGVPSAWSHDVRHDTPEAAVQYSMGHLLGYVQSCQLVWSYNAAAMKGVKMEFKIQEKKEA